MTIRATKSMTAAALCAGALMMLGLTFRSADAQSTSVAAAKPAEIGEEVTDFKLVDTDGKEHRLSDYTKDGKTVVLEWFNPGCPFVVRHHAGATIMRDTFERFEDKDVVWLAINSGAPGKQGHGKELNAKKRTEWEIEYPVLLDESGEVGRSFGARTTPHMFIVSADNTLVYKGAIDSDPRGRSDTPVNYVEAALEAHLAGKPVEEAETKPYGCGVKYGRN